MYVRSEDGLKCDDAPCHVNKPDGLSKEWRVFGHTGDFMAEFATKEEALARMDDVCAWLDAPQVLFVLDGKLIDIFRQRNIPDEDYARHIEMERPLVYEFSRAIGYWEEVN